MNNTCWLAALLLSAVPLVPVAANDSDFDVAVYGSTPGGFCAAIAAAREGASVVLLEPTDHVGGMNTGGLSHCDSNQMVRSTVMGLFHEWHMRVVADYTERGLTAPYNPTVKDQSRWTFEPHVAMRVTMQMLNEAGVTVLTDRYLQSVIKDGPRITTLVTKDDSFTARCFVDGTYEGDLMAAAAVDWTIGREGRQEYGESLAGRQYPKQKMNINGFDDEGRLLPLVTTNDAGPDDAGDKNVMAYSFRLCLTADSDNRLPMPEPTNYDPARFEIVRRALKAGVRVGFDLYPLPGTKLDGNNSIGGQFSLGLVGGGNDWHSADEAERKNIWEAHKQYSLELYHFLTTDPTVPAKIRSTYARLGLCRDEFASYDHFSPALYVRESRRMKGMYVISQKDILEDPEKDDPIAVSSFPIDSHDCQRVAFKGGGVINEGTIFPVRRKVPKQGYAYHVPYRSILPQTKQCDNLLVPVALSCTHVGISSLRIEGAWMIIGQSAGIAAALAADHNVTVQNLPYPQLRKRLLAQGQVLELPDVSSLPLTTGSIVAKSLPGIVLDDATAKLTGNWDRSTNFKPYIEEGYVYSGRKDANIKGDERSTAVFHFKVPKSGRYRMFMAYSPHETRATNVPVTVASGAYTKLFTVDQTIPLPTGKHFRPVGIVDLQSDMESTITVTNTDTNGFVILDALQLLPEKEVEAVPVPDRLVVLTFDDSAVTHATHVGPLLKKYGFGATFFITEGFNFTTNKKAYMTWEQIRDLHKAGFEIGNHTRRHTAVSRQTAAEVDSDVAHIEEQCVKYGIPKPVSFCYPGYATSDAAVNVLSERGYRFARAGGARAFNPAKDNPLLMPQAFDGKPDSTFEQFVEATALAKDGKIAVMTFHGIPDGPHPWVSTTPAMLERYLKHLADEKCTVVALRELAKYVPRAKIPARELDDTNNSTGSIDR